MTATQSMATAVIPAVTLSQDTPASECPQDALKQPALTLALDHPLPPSHHNLLQQSQMHHSLPPKIKIYNCMVR